MEETRKVPFFYKSSGTIDQWESCLCLKKKSFTLVSHLSCPHDLTTYPSQTASYKYEARSISFFFYFFSLFSIIPYTNHRKNKHAKNEFHRHKYINSSKVIQCTWCCQPALQPAPIATRLDLAVRFQPPSILLRRYVFYSFIWLHLYNFHGRGGEIVIYLFFAKPSQLHWQPYA